MCIHIAKSWDLTQENQSMYTYGTLAIGARQLVVQLALETMFIPGLYDSWLTPITNMGASAEGAEMTTFLAPPWKNKHPCQDVTKQCCHFFSNPLVQLIENINISTSMKRVEYNLEMGFCLGCCGENTSRLHNKVSSS